MKIFVYSLYHILYQGKESGQKSGILITTTKPPKIGKCSVFPTSGEPIEVLFNITCTDFEDEYYSERNIPSILKYEFYDAKPNDNTKGKSYIILQLLNLYMRLNIYLYIIIILYVHW